MSIEEKIKELNIKLPDPKDPVGAYVASKIVGNLLYISGQISINDKGDLIKGKVGKDLDVNQGYEAAKRCGLAIISQVKKACNDDLSKVKSCVKLTGYVNSTDNFTDQPKIINGASDLLVNIFGEQGKHARFAVGSNSLPMNISVEIDAIIKIK